MIMSQIPPSHIKNYHHHIYHKITKLKSNGRVGHIHESPRAQLRHLCKFLAFQQDPHPRHQILPRGPRRRGQLRQKSPRHGPLVCVVYVRIDAVLIVLAPGNQHHIARRGRNLDIVAKLGIILRVHVLVL